MKFTESDHCVNTAAWLFPGNYELYTKVKVSCSGTCCDFFTLLVRLTCKNLDEAKEDDDDQG